MRLILAAVGRLGATPENLMVRDYLQRASLGGKALGLGPIDLVEIDAKKKPKDTPINKALEAEAIKAALGENLCLITCDERGELLTSRQIASRIEKLKDSGERKLVFLIGGADGLGAELIRSARFSLAFGPQTWPHALARVMLAEQIYRSVSILNGAPYHRD
jgi:23S rRNA (pseudouridine1915-N3)-methyltransferase